LKFVLEVLYANEKNIKFSIHHPILLCDWYKEDYLSAFYISTDTVKKEKSFRLLEVNLKNYFNSGAEYFVIHFPGIILDGEKPKNYGILIDDSLNRLNELAKKYNVKILLEYFGSNKWFFDIDEWIEKIFKYSNLGILTDTGHLYFSSVMHGFNFMESLKKLSDVSSAFHLWTTKEGGVYSDSEYYKKYHHVVININQKRVDGWAFDSKDVLDLLISKGRPIIFEASPYYGGIEYFEKSLKEIVEYISCM